ncbi:MAG TPA: DUF6094 domain-containing protein [Bacillales bacterium]|nr:DUF6094 domain-containing protein [Bacillales bacterium]
MARLATQSKRGYYPTPVNELNLMKDRLVVNHDETINLMDPCCGTGEALGLLNVYLRSVGAKSMSYGVELEGTRAVSAAIELDHVIHDGYETMRTETHHSLLFLNPPYQPISRNRSAESKSRNRAEG